MYGVVANDILGAVDRLGLEAWYFAEPSKPAALQERVATWNAGIAAQRRNFLRDLNAVVGKNIHYKWVYYKEGRTERGSKRWTVVEDKGLSREELLRRVNSEKIHLKLIDFKSPENDIKFINAQIEANHRRPWDTTAYFHHTTSWDLALYSERVRGRSEVESLVSTRINPRIGNFFYASCVGSMLPSLKIDERRRVSFWNEFQDIEFIPPDWDVRVGTKKCYVVWRAFRLTTGRTPGGHRIEDLEEE